MVNGFKVITLCGSTRFKDEFLEAQKRLTLEGNIVISVGLFGHSGDDEVWTEGVKDMLDRQHLAKIDLADEIFVINVGGYIGESTRREIAYAEFKGKSVVYLENHRKPSIYDKYAALGELHDLRRLSDEEWERAGYFLDERRIAAIAEYNTCEGPWPYQWNNIDAVVCGILQKMGQVPIDIHDLSFLYDSYCVWEMRISSQNSDASVRIKEIENELKKSYDYILGNAQKLIATYTYTSDKNIMNDDLSHLHEVLGGYLNEKDIVWQVRRIEGTNNYSELSLIVKNKYDDWVSRVCSFLSKVGPTLGKNGTHCASFQSKPVLERQPDVVFLGYNPHEEWNYYRVDASPVRFYEGNPSFYTKDRKKWKVWRIDGLFDWAGYKKPVTDGNFVFFNSIYFGTRNITNFKRIPGSSEAIEKCLVFTEEVLQRIFKPKCIICFSVDECFSLLNNRFGFKDVISVDTARMTDQDIIEYVKSKKSGAWQETHKCNKPIMKGFWNGIPVYGIPHPSSRISNNDLGAAVLYLRSELQKII